MKYLRSLVLGGLLLASPAAAQPEEAKAGLVAVRIVSADFEKSIRFYTILGMQSGQVYNDHEQQIKGPNGSNGPDIILYRTTSTSRLRLIPGNSSMAIFVGNMDETLRKLRAAGFTDISPPGGSKDYVIVFAKDPDGNAIEMIQPAPRTK